MRTLLPVSLCLLSLPGCALVRDLVGKGRALTGPATEVVVPGQLLDGDAARLQDSLRPRLQWLGAHGPESFPATRIAFRSGIDSSEPAMLLEIDIEEPERRNAHRRTAEDLARLEALHILSVRPWAREAVASKVSQPLSVRVVFRSKDFLNSAGRYQDDTVTVRYADSSAFWKGSRLPL